MRKSLRVLITNKCNLSCSFCNQKEQMSSYPKPIKNLEDVLLRHLDENNYDEFCISGGEPLLDISTLEKVLGVLIPLNKRITINTNATRLTPTLAYNLSKFDNIHLQISIDGVTGKYRGLNTLVDKSVSGLGLIEIIRFLPRKNINFVVPRNRLNDLDLPIEIASLHSIFKCKIQLLLDENEHHLYDIDDAFNIQNLDIRLKELKVEYSFNSFFLSSCNGDCNQDLYWNGEFKRDCNIEGIGCSEIRLRMKPGLYDLINKIVHVSSNEYKIGNIDNYVYSLQSNLNLTEDLKFKPIFKHSIDGNKRFSKLDQIKIIEIK